MIIDLAATIEALKPATAHVQDYYWDTETKGFGVVIGRAREGWPQGMRTFVARAWVGDKKRRVKIGIAGSPWTVADARVAARKLLGRMSSGEDPNATKRPGSKGPRIGRLLLRALSRESESPTSVGLADRLRGEWNSSERARDYALRRKYGISADAWDAIWHRQKQRCACCRVRDPGSRKGWHTDHDHATGRVRGILCGNCNRVLGLLGDSASGVAASCERFLSYLGRPSRSENGPNRPVRT